MEISRLKNCVDQYFSLSGENPRCSFPLQIPRTEKEPNRGERRGSRIGGGAARGGRPVVVVAVPAGRVAGRLAGRRRGVLLPLHGRHLHGPRHWPDHAGAPLVRAPDDAAREGGGVAAPAATRLNLVVCVLHPPPPQHGGICGLSTTSCFALSNRLSGVR